ncbi:MAG: ankyrin repeat domain-containing protein [Vulcanimicrobiota bacterium]
MSTTGRTPENPEAETRVTALLPTLQSIPEGTLCYPPGEMEHRHAENASPDWKPGDIIADLYEVITILGEGGFGKVYQVRHRAWDYLLAVKSLRADLAMSEEHNAAFIRECEGWINLGLHPDIVSCYYVRLLGGTPRIFSEYMLGGSLEEWLEKDREQSLPEVIDMAIQVLDGLAFAHSRGLTHRDIKPGNCLLDGKGKLKITDFGIASGLQAFKGEIPSLSGQSPTGNTMAVKEGVVGTPAYMPPEQWEPGQYGTAGPWSDIYAFGVMLFEMCCGERPFDEGGEIAEVLKVRHLTTEPPDPCSINSAIPPALGKCILRCLEKQPDKRFHSCGGVREELASIYRFITEKPYPRPKPHDVDWRADSLNNRAISLIDLGLSNDALAAWDEALAADVLHSQAAFNSALVRWRKGDIDDLSVLESLRHIKHERPEAWEVDYYMGLVHLERDDCASTVEALSAAFELSGHNNEVAAALAEAKKYQKASSGLVKTCPVEVKNTFFTHIAVSSDNRYALLGGQNGVDLWDSATGMLFNLSGGSIGALALRSDSTMLITGGAITGEVSILNLVSRKHIKSFHDYGRERILLADISGDASHAVYVTVKQEKTPILWEIESNRFLIDEQTVKNLKYTLKEDDLNRLRPLMMRAFTKEGLEEALRKFLGPNRIPSVLKHADRRISRLEGHKDKVTAVRFFPDSRQVLTTSLDGTLKIWNLADMKCTETMEHGEPLHDAALSSDGALILSMGEKAIKVWAPGKTEPLNIFSNFHRDQTVSLHISSDKAWFATGGKDQIVRLYRLDNGRCHRSFEAVGRAYGISPDASVLIDSVKMREVRVWNINKANFHRAAGFALSRIVETDVISEEKRAYLQHLDNANAQIDRENWPGALEDIKKAREVAGYERSPEGFELWQNLYSHCSRKGLQAAWCRLTIDAHGQGVTSLSLDGRGKRAVSGGEKGTVILWNIEKGKPIRVIEGNWGRTTGVHLSEDGQLILSGHQDCIMRLWKTESGECLQHFKVAAGTGVDSVFLSRDRRLALSAGSSGLIQLWDVASGACLQELLHPETYINPLKIAMDHTCRRVLSSKYSVKVWDLLTGAVTATMKEQDLEVSAFHMSPGGRWALTAGIKGSISLWDLHRMAVKKTITGQGISAGALDLSPCGRWAVSGGSSYAQQKDSAIRIWDFHEGRCIRSLEGHTQDVTGVQFSSDCSFMVSCSADRTIRVWTLDWELEAPAMQDFPSGAGICIEEFLDCHTSPTLMSGLSKSDLAAVLARKRGAQWNERDFDNLLYTLGCAGFGWLEKAAVKAELERRTALRGGIAGGRPASLDRTPVTAEPVTLPLSEPVTLPLSEPETLPLSSSVATGQTECLRKASLERITLQQTINAHEKPVRIFCLDCEGEKAATGGSDGVIKIWDLQGNLVATAGKAHGWKPLLSCTFADRGRTLVTGHGDGTIALWDSATGALKKSVEAYDKLSLVISLSVDAEYKRILSAGRRFSSGSVKLWDSESWQCLDTIDLEDKSSESGMAAFLAGRQEIVIVDGELIRVRESSGSERRMAGHVRLINTLALCPEQPWGISGSLDRTLRIWDFLQGTCLRIFSEENHGAIVAAAITGDRLWALSASSTTIHVWDSARQTIAGLCSDFKSPLTALALKPDGSAFFTGHEDGTLCHWSIEWQYEKAELTPGEAAALPALPFEVPGKEKDLLLVRKAEEFLQARDYTGTYKALLNIGSRPGYTPLPEALSLWRQILRRGRRLGPGRHRLSAVCRADESECTALKVGRSGRNAVTGGREGLIRIWTLPWGTCQAVHGRGEGWGAVCDLALSDDEKTAVVLFQGFIIRHIDMETGKCLKTREIKGAFSAVVMSADGETTAAVPKDASDWRNIHLWRRTENPVTLAGHLEKVETLSMSEDGAFLLSCDDSGSVKLWDLNAQVCLSTHQDKEINPRTLQLRNGGNQALWIGWNGAISYWDRAPGKEIKTLLSPGGPFKSVCTPVFCFDSRWALSGTDNAIRLWNLQQGLCGGTITGHSDNITLTQMSPDGLYLIGVSADRVMRIWTMEWQMDFPEEGGCDDGADSVIREFLSRQELAGALTGQGMEKLMEELELGGYGWMERAKIAERCERIGAELDVRKSDEKQGYPLHRAAALGSADEVKALLASRNYHDSRDGEGLTPLHLASVGGHQDVVRLLVDIGATLDCVDRQGTTPLMLASREGHEGVVKILLSARAGVNISDAQGRTALHHSAGNGQSRIAALLLQQGAEPDSRDLRKHQGNGGLLTPLHIAAEGSDPPTVKALLDGGADVEARSYYNDTPLHLAAEKGSREIVEMLLKRGADVDARSTSEETPLHRSAKSGRDEAIAVLTTWGAEIHAHNSTGDTPLHLAAASCKAAEILLRRGALVNLGSRDLTTPLHNAARSGSAEAVALLLKYGADVTLTDLQRRTAQMSAPKDSPAAKVLAAHPHAGKTVAFAPGDIEGARKKMPPHKAGLLERLGIGGLKPIPEANVRDDKGMTPMHHAAGSARKLKELIEKGGNPNIRDNRGMTPLFHAARLGSTDAVRELLDAFANPGLKDSDQATALHFASAGGHLEIVRLLLDKKAPVSASSRTSTTPLHEAVSRNHIEVVKLLLERGADPTIKDTGYGTPLQVAQRNSAPSDPGEFSMRSAIARLLVQAEADFRKGNPRS